MAAMVFIVAIDDGRLWDGHLPEGMILHSFPGFMFTGNRELGMWIDLTTHDLHNDEIYAYVGKANALYV